MVGPKRKRKQRKGLAVVECAVTLPIVLLVIFATVEICNFIFLKQSLTVASYEGARVAIVPDSTLENVEVQVERILESRGIQASGIIVAPADIASVSPGELIEVSVEAKPSDNSLMNGMLSQGRTIKATVQMMKEY